MHSVVRRLSVAVIVLVAAALVAAAAIASPLVSVGSVAAAPAAPSASPSAPPPNDDPWVTGYYAGWYWDQGLEPHEIDMTAMTHFVFGRVAPGGGSLYGTPGQLVEGAGTAHEPAASPYPGTTVEDEAVRLAHAAGAKALLMLGGDGLDGRGFVASTTDALRPAFVKTVVDYLVEHDYDGVDIDWENCIGGEAWECGVDISVDESVRRLTALIREIRAEMATRARYAAEPGIITFPGYPVSINELGPGGTVADWQVEVALLVDQYNLMSYGIGTTWNGAGWDSWFSGALDGESGTHPVSIDSSIEAYVRSGVPRERIGMGIGFYGIYYGPTITGPRQSTDDAGNDIYEVDDNALAYENLVRLGYLDHGVRHFDAEASSTYRVYDGGYIPALDPDRYPAGMLSYEDEESIAAKGAYTRAGGAGGTIIWTLNYGALPDGSNPLLEAVKQAFLADAPEDPDAPGAIVSVPDAPASGWFTDPVTVRFEGIPRQTELDRMEIVIDGGEPLVLDEGEDEHELVIDGDGRHEVVLTVFDVDGRSTTSRATVRIDTTAPAIELRSPAAAASGARALAPGEVEQGSDVRADFSCGDPHSGIASCTGTVANGAHVPTSTLGEHEFTVTARNGAGLESTTTVTYRVVAAAAAPVDPVLAATGAAWIVPAVASSLLVAAGTLLLMRRRAVRSR